MSHEIRTPLNGVIGFTDLLQSTPLSPVQDQYVRNANTCGHTLLGIINDILDFSKIEAGMMDLEIIKTDIIELLEQSVDIIKYTAAKKKLEVLLNIDSSMPRFAFVDPVRLKQIIANLMGNAVKFTAKGEIELKVNYEDAGNNKGRFSFSVRDTGIGITEEQRSKLFKAFSQADSSTTRKFGGTGLGLIISEMIAKKMGSEIRIKSALGKGATFYFDIVTPVEYGEKFDSATLQTIKRCFVIDDNDNNRMILEHLMANWGIECDSCDNGLTALKLIEASEQPFDVIICDYHMPYIDGLETIKMVREKLQLSPEKQPIILLHSSSDDEELHKKCNELGVRFTLTKPIKSEELYRYLQLIHTPDSEDKSAGKTLIEALNAKPVTILIAEDAPINMALIKAILQKLTPNAEILETTNGEDTLDMAITQKPDIILMDIQMPKMDGIESTMEIRKFEHRTEGHIPIIALTAGAVKGEEEKCREAGMDGFLTKPIDQKALYRLLKKFLTQVYEDRAPHSETRVANEAVPHFDEKELLERVGNNNELAQKLMGMFLLQFPKYIESLRQAIQQNNHNEILKIAHTIKGSSSNMSLNQLTGLAKKIEANVDKNEINGLNELFNAMLSEWEKVKALFNTINSLPIHDRNSPVERNM